MRRDNPSRFESRTLTADTTLTTQNVMIEGLFMADAPGITITLPAPQEGIAHAECMVANNSNGAVTISAVNGFPNSGSTINLAAAAGVILYCAGVSGSTFVWASAGATAS